MDILQTEDESGYGAQFRSTPSFNYNKGPSCFTWVVIAMLSTCKELWEIIDTKESPFRESSWEGWMMTYTQCLCFENNVVYSDRASPFKKIKSMCTAIEKLNCFMLVGLHNSTRLDGNAFFKFDISCIRELFELQDYRNSILIGSSVNECVQRIANKNHVAIQILIIVNIHAATALRLTANEN